MLPIFAGGLFMSLKMRDWMWIVGKYFQAAVVIEESLILEVPNILRHIPPTKVLEMRMQARVITNHFFENYWLLLKWILKYVGPVGAPF